MLHSPEAVCFVEVLQGLERGAGDFFGGCGKQAARVLFFVSGLSNWQLLLLQ